MLRAQKVSEDDLAMHVKFKRAVEAVRGVCLHPSQPWVAAGLASGRIQVTGWLDLEYWALLKLDIGLDFAA